METAQTLPTTKSTGIRYGVIQGIVSIIVFLALVLTSADMNGPAKWISYPIYAAIIFMAHKYFKDRGDGYMSFSQGIGIAFWMGLIGSAISSVFSYIYLKFIDSGFIDLIKAQQLEQFEKQGMSEAQIEQAVKISSMFMTPEAFLAIGLIFGVIGIVIVALIVTIFTQKRNPEQVV